MSECRQLILARSTAGAETTIVYYAPISENIKNGDIAVIRAENCTIDGKYPRFLAYEIISVVTVEENSPAEQFITLIRKGKEITPVYAIAKKINYEDESV